MAERKYDLNCKECQLWDEVELKCSHPENPEPDAEAYPDDGCDYGRPIEQ